MNIVFIGTGYVGLVSGTCFAELGYHVTCLDRDKKKIAALNDGEMPIFEPGLKELVEKNMARGKLLFSTDKAAYIPSADVVFIAVGTPPHPDNGNADLSFVFGVADEIAPLLKSGVTLVTKSTVPVGTGKRIRNIIQKRSPALNFEVVSNPEFLREGCAVNDFLNPDRVVIGAESAAAAEVMKHVYKPLTDKGVEVLYTDLQTSELIKYTANAFLATKIAFINEAADMCEHVGANVVDLARGIGLDQRIGNNYLSPGPGYGGSCFPKDTQALQCMAVEWNVSERLVSATITSNERRKLRMARRIMELVPAGGTVGLLGLAFKANTDDVRESPALAIVQYLLQQHMKLRCYDPEAMRMAKRMIADQQGIDWCADSYEAALGADILVIATEWNEFRQLDLDKIKAALRQPVIFDLRNLFYPEDIKQAGLRYISIGRPEVKAKLSHSKKRAV